MLSTGPYGKNVAFPGVDGTFLVCANHSRTVSVCHGGTLYDAETISPALNLAELAVAGMHTQRNESDLVLV